MIIKTLKFLIITAATVCFFEILAFLRYCGIVMEELNFYQLAKKKMEFDKIGVGNTALDETYPAREDIPAELWGKPIVVSEAPPYGPEIIEEKHDPQHYQKGNIQVWDFIADQKLDFFKTLHCYQNSFYSLMLKFVFVLK